MFYFSPYPPSQFVFKIYFYQKETKPTESKAKDQETVKTKWGGGGGGGATHTPLKKKIYKKRVKNEL